MKDKDLNIRYDVPFTMIDSSILLSELIKLGFIEKREQTNAKGEYISNIYHIRVCSPKAVDNSPLGGVQDIPCSECDTPPDKCGTPDRKSTRLNSSH